MVEATQVSITDAIVSDLVVLYHDNSMVDAPDSSQLSQVFTKRIFAVARGHQILLKPDASTICIHKEAICCDKRSSKIVEARFQYNMHSQRGYLLWPEVIKDC